MFSPAPEGTELPAGLGRPVAGVVSGAGWGTLRAVPTIASGGWEHSPLTSVL